jgi:hypothetical protein
MVVVVVNEEDGDEQKKARKPKEGREPKKCIGFVEGNPGNVLQVQRPFKPS